MRARAEAGLRHAARCAPAALLCAALLHAQSAGPRSQGPIAIVALDTKDPASAATVTGSLEVTQGKAVIAASGSVTAGKRTAEVMLPQRGVLRVCASTTVKLAADSSAPAAEKPGLMMAMEHGAVEASFAAGSSADVLLTPDFRILIGGPGAVDLKVRLGQGGDTCVDNTGASAPYVLVTSVFDGANYRVQPGQRVMFQHGSAQQVVDNEKEPCGCPPEPQGNDFPLAQSAGMAPLAEPQPGPVTVEGKPAVAAPPLVHNADGTAQEAGAPAVAPNAAPAQTGTQSAAKKPGFLARVGHFFRRIFGAE